MATPPVLRVVEHDLVVFRRTWRGSVGSSFLGPILYLLAMGVGLGALVDGGRRAATLGAPSYLSFIAPALIATAAMQTAAQQSTFPVMAGVKWLKFYDAMLATPLGVRDLVGGHLVSLVLRLTLTCGAYLGVVAAFGVVASPLALLALPAAILCGLAFAAPIAAFAVTQENDQNFALLFRVGLVPLFLFSGAFFPISRLPAGIRPVAYLTPIWHGVELCRGLVLGRIGGLAALGHVAYLSLWLAAGTRAALRTFTRRLVG